MTTVDNGSAKMTVPVSSVTAEDDPYRPTPSLAKVRAEISNTYGDIARIALVNAREFVALADLYDKKASPLKRFVYVDEAMQCTEIALTFMKQWKELINREPLGPDGPSPAGG